MRYPLIVALLFVGPSVTFAGGVIKWPDAAIPVPHLVHTFIVAECLDYAGTTDEDIDACVAGERYGYRATVMMLSDSEIGEKAAERYRACRAGLGMHGGRFHRRRADCIGNSFRYMWRFQSTRRASIPEPDLLLRTAVEDAPSTSLNDHLVPRTEENAQHRRGSKHSRLGFNQVHRASVSEEIDRKCTYNSSGC